MPAWANDIKFGMPIACEIDKDCYIQNLPDVTQGSDVFDTFCKGAAYDGHKGIDIRVLSMKDLARNVPIVASADGIIKAYRDGEPDRLVQTPQERTAVKGKECGNGVVISHPNGFESQYCHLKQGSITVKKGQKVKQGDVLGFVGNSGFAAFPHIHFGVRKNGQWLDPITGNPPSNSCNFTNTDNSLMEETLLAKFQADTSRLLSSGITGAVINHQELVKTGAPKKLQISDTAIVGWSWFINLRKGDRISIKLEGPNGLISENVTKPLTKNQASYSAFTGKKRNAEKGEYQFTTKLLRAGKVLQETLTVQILE